MLSLAYAPGLLMACMALLFSLSTLCTACRFVNLSRA